jgi:hypothetical protein
MADHLNGNIPGRCCADFLCLPPQLTLTPQHKCLMCDLMVYIVCSNEVNDGQQMCFLCDSGANEDNKEEDEVQIPSVVEQARESLQLAIQRARATECPFAAVEDTGDLVNSAAMTKAASLSFSLAVAPDMVTPITKKMKKEKKMDDEVLPTITSRVKDRLPKMKMKKGSRVKTQRKLLYHLCSIVQRRKLPGDTGNTYNVYGPVTRDNSSKGWDVRFDLFPPENKIILGVLRNRLMLVAEGAEENEHDRDIGFADYEEVTTLPQQAATINKSPQQKISLELPPPKKWQHRHPTSSSGARPNSIKLNGTFSRMRMKSHGTCQSLTQKDLSPSCCLIREPSLTRCFSRR